MLLRLAHHCSHRQNYHCKPLQCAQKYVFDQTVASTRCIVGRWGTQFTSRAFQDFLGHPSQNVHTVLFPKRRYSEQLDRTILNKSVLCQVLMQYRNTLPVRDGLKVVLPVRDGLKVGLPVRDGLKLYGHPIQGTLPIHQCMDFFFHQSGSTAERRQNNTLSNHRRQQQQDTISQPTTRDAKLLE